MCQVDLIIAIRANHQQVPRVGMEEEIFDERQRGRIEPLQVIDENDKRVFRPREYADKPLKYGLKPQLGVDRRDVGSEDSGFETQNLGRRALGLGAA